MCGRQQHTSITLPDHMTAPLVLTNVYLPAVYDGDPQRQLLQASAGSVVGTLVNQDGQTRGAQYSVPITIHPIHCSLIGSLISHLGSALAVGRMWKGPVAVPDEKGKSTITTQLISLRPLARVCLGSPPDVNTMVFSVKVQAIFSTTDHEFALDIARPPSRA
jgi:hypothetical protein